MATLRDFLASREGQIREQIKLLRAELAELKRAKAAIEQPGDSLDEGVEGEVRDSSRTTIKDMIRTVFAQPAAANGLGAGEVLEAIERSFNVKLERTSLSPQLSRLRESGDVVLQDGRWFSSEPRLSQVVSVEARPTRGVHYGGGEIISAVSTVQEAARTMRATMVTQTAAEEARRLARTSILSAGAMDATKLASGTFGPSAAMEAATQSSRMTASAVAFAQSMPNTMKAIEDADRQMRSLIHGPEPRGTQKNWGSSPKTK